MREHEHRPRRRWPRIAPEQPIAPPPTYEDGTYLVSGMGEAATWAVCDRGRWGLVYELDGSQVLAAWVDEDTIPLHVLVEALSLPHVGGAQ